MSDALRAEMLNDDGLVHAVTKQRSSVPRLSGSKRDEDAAVLRTADHSGGSVLAVANANRGQGATC